MTQDHERNKAREAKGLTPFARPQGVPWANVGRKHPDYGLTQQEHMTAKRERNAP